MSITTITDNPAQGTYADKALDDLDVKDSAGATLVRDYQGQPAQSSSNIPTGSDHGLTFRAIRFDGAAGAGGAVVCDLLKSDGTRDAAVTQNVSAGEVWSRSSACVPKIGALPAGITARGEG